MGSLNDQLELFELLVCLPAATVVDPDAVVSDFEKHILYMKKVVDSNFTINIQMQNEADKHMPHCSKNNDCGDKNLYRLICPVCSKPFPTEEIEKHASDCAASKYPLVFESDISDNNDMELPVLLERKEIVVTNICESLKDIVGKCAVDQSHAIKIKVRRNYIFSDFCERIEKPWIQNKLGCSFSVEFYGESALLHYDLKIEFSHLDTLKKLSWCNVLESDFRNMLALYFSVFLFAVFSHTIIILYIVFLVKTSHHRVSFRIIS